MRNANETEQLIKVKKNNQAKGILNIKKNPRLRDRN